MTLCRNIRTTQLSVMPYYHLALTNNPNLYFILLIITSPQSSHSFSPSVLTRPTDRLPFPFLPAPLPCAREIIALQIIRYWRLYVIGSANKKKKKVVAKRLDNLGEKHRRVNCVLYPTGLKCISLPKCLPQTLKNFLQILTKFLIKKR